MPPIATKDQWRTTQQTENHAIFCRPRPHPLAQALSALDIRPRGRGGPLVELGCPLFVAVNYVFARVSTVLPSQFTTGHASSRISSDFLCWTRVGSVRCSWLSVLLVRTNYCVYLPSSSLRILFLGSRIPTALSVCIRRACWISCHALICSEVSVVNMTKNSRVPSRYTPSSVLYWLYTNFYSWSWGHNSLKQHSFRAWVYPPALLHFAGVRAAPRA